MTLRSEKNKRTLIRSAAFGCATVVAAGVTAQLALAAPVMGDWKTMNYAGTDCGIDVRFGTEKPNSDGYWAYFQYRNRYTSPVRLKMEFQTDKGTWTDYYNLSAGELSRTDWHVCDAPESAGARILSLKIGK